MTVSSGIAMEIHYCMGKKAGIDFYQSENEDCSRCGMKEKKGGCCSDEHKFFKLKDFHKNVANDIHFSNVDLALQTDYPVYSWQAVVEQPSCTPNNHSPPINTGPSACILHCVFRL